MSNLGRLFIKNIVAVPQDDESDISWMGKSSNRSITSKPEEQYLLISYSTKKDGIKRSAFTFYEPFVKELRWQLGDKIMVGEDTKGNVVIKRVTSGGYSLSTSVAQENRGPVFKLNFHTPYIGNEKKYYGKNEITITDSGLVFIKKEVAADKETSH